MSFHSCTRVLIVEDDVIIALMMVSIVEDLGYEVVGPSIDFNTALQIAKRDELDFALLDFNLGQGEDAGPIAGILADRGIPFAFTTGLSPASIRATYGEATIISKPVVEKELFDLLP